MQNAQEFAKELESKNPRAFLALAEWVGAMHVWSERMAKSFAELNAEVKELRGKK